MRNLRKALRLLLCLGAALMLMPMTVLAGMANNGVMTGTGTWGIDVDNNQNGVIVAGNYTKTVYNKGGLIVGGSFTNPIVDDGTGRYGLQLKLTDTSVDNSVNLYEYNGIKYGIMPYNADFTFTLVPDSAGGYSLPEDIAITRAGSPLSSQTDYSYDSNTGAVTINAAVVNYPLVLEAAGRKIEVGAAIDETNFPDEIFRKYIQDNFDKNSSGVLTDDEIKEIKAIKVGLVEPTIRIKSLKGIELFPQLESLTCLDLAQLTSIDTSANKALKTLVLEGSWAISGVNVGQNPELEYLNCAYSSVTSLNLNNNLKLKQLYINATDIESLDLSKNEKLEVLNCYNASELTSIDLSDKPALFYLEVGGTSITEIDTSSNPLLSSFFCSNTQISALDVSRNPELKSFACQNNKMGFLNLGTQSIHQALFRVDREMSVDVAIAGDEFDITELFKGINIGKINIISGGTLKGGTISGYQADEPIIYEYDCGTNMGESVIIEVTLNLKKSESSVSINKSLEKTYDKKPVSLTEKDLTITGSKGEVSFTWEMLDGDNWRQIKSAPSEPGTYRVTAHVAEDAYYKAADSEVQEFRIKKQEDTNPQDRPQDKPKDDTTGNGKKQEKAVQTGDTARISLYVVLSLLSGVGVILLLGRRKRIERK